MSHTLEDLRTYVFVIVDDLSRLNADSEVIPLAVVAESVGIDKESHFLRYLRRNHRALFPCLPERSRLNRRRRVLGEAINTIRRLLGCWLGRILYPEP